MTATFKELYQKFLSCTSVSIDSREVTENAMFFALRGENCDGNQYAADALEKGCAFAVIDNEKYQVNENCILVQNVLIALQQLSNIHRKQLQTTIIAITGTNGKTTTKEYVTRVLSKQYAVQSTVGNLNNHIGVPLTLLSLIKDTEIAIVEMGANHIGEIEFLCSIAMPDFGIITNIGKAHLEGFGSVEGVVKAKGELYEYLSKGDGSIIINKDNYLLEELAGEIEQFSYGISEDADVIGELLSESPELVLKFKSGQEQSEITCNTQIIGKQNFENIMAAIGVGVKFKVAYPDIKTAIESYVPTNNRSQVIKTKNNNVLLDAYNANPMNMKASIDNFARLDGANKTVILGDMLELGGYSDAEHRKIIALLKNHGFPMVILVGDNFAKVKNMIQCSHFSTSSEVASWLENNPIEDALVLIKGSRGIGLESLAEKL